MSDRPMDKNYGAWAHQDILNFYTNERCSVEGLYDSERVVLEPAVRACVSVLDVGCAAGGFYPILNALRPGIRYVGVDTSAAMIETARQRYPDARFEVRDGAALGVPEAAFDLVFCTGVLLHNPNYREMIAELYRAAAVGCVIDLPRLTAMPYTFDRVSAYTVLKQRFGIQEGTLDAQQTTVPYIVAQAQPIVEFLCRGLHPKPRAVIAVGYYGDVHPAVVLPFRRACFCVVYLAKGSDEARRTRVLLDLPEDIRATISLADVELVAGGRAAVRPTIEASLTSR